MIKSKLQMYVAYDIVKSRNMIIDNLLTYLQGKKFYSATIEYNFIKPALNLEVVVPIDDLVKTNSVGAKGSYDLMCFKGAMTPTYCSIYRDTDTSTTPATTFSSIFYFIDKIEWKSDKAVKLYLTMDVLNSFPLNSVVFLSNMTTLKRAHRDRFMVHPSDNTKMIRVIDRTPEGFSPLLYKSSTSGVGQQYETTTGSGTGYQGKWFLVYRTKENPENVEYNPIQLYVMPEYSIRAKAYWLNAFTASWFANNSITFVRVTSAMNSNKDLYMCLPYDSKFFKISGNPYSYDNPMYYVEFTYVGGTVTYSYNVATAIRTGVNTYVWSSSTIESGTTTGGNINTPNAVYATTDSTQSVSSISHNLTLTPTLSDGLFALQGIDTLDRTDSKFIKIIELPYAPFKISRYYNQLVIGEGADFARFDASHEAIGIYNFTYFNVKLDNIDDSILTTKYARPTASDLTTAYNPDNESKLYHSEFYNKKYYYDSFSQVIKLENIDTALYNLLYTDPRISIHFIMSNTIQSKMLFAFEGLDTYYSHKDEDFPSILPVSRNNEVSLYNSNYLNYLRTGYNYDLKSKQRQEISAGIGLGLATLGSVAGVGLGIASGNPAVAISAGLSGVTSLTSSVVNTVNQTITNEENLQAKIATLKAQSLSVNNIDDVSLLDYYGNSLYTADYKVSDKVKNALAYMFHTIGYKMDIHTNGLISYMNSRKWFNFIQADLDISYTTMNLSPEIINEIKAKYSEGVLVFHRNSINGTYTYNFSMSYENWEVSTYVNN